MTKKLLNATETEMVVEGVIGLVEGGGSVKT